MSLRKCRDCLVSKSLDGFHICNVVGDKKYYRRKCKDCHRQQLRDNAKKHYVKNKPEIMCKAKLRERRKRKDPAYRLRSNISRSIREALTKVGSSKGNRSFFQYVNYTLEELKAHFDSHFESWMSWANYGMYEEGGWNDADASTWKWNIDHVVPQSKLLYDSMTHPNFRRCWSLDNLRPVNAKLNLMKSNS